MLVISLAFTSTASDPVTPETVAVTLAWPGPVEFTTPLDETVTILSFEEDQVAEDVTSFDDPSV